MTFSHYFSDQDPTDRWTALSDITADRVRQVLAQERVLYSDLDVLLSPAAAPFLETMATRANALTIQRFGKTMKLFAPLYLSNRCYNQCTYCGYSMELDYKRVTLSQAEIQNEARILKEKGFQHVLLLTGEAPDEAGVSYLKSAIETVRPYFSSVGLEVQPLKESEYDMLVKAGADNLSVYQETYHKESYLIHHLMGKKRRFEFRMDTLDRAGKSGFFRVNVGALLGLYDWRYEALSLGLHLSYLQKKYWQIKLGLSVPRIQKMLGEFDPPYPVSDSDLVQMVCAFRLVFPDLHITMSTREKSTLRDNLVHLGITDMSAESDTSPGGYSGKGAEEQFEISDKRSLQEVCQHLSDQGFDPLLKDWDQAYIKS